MVGRMKQSTSERSPRERPIEISGKPPLQRRPDDLAGYLEALSRPVLEAGISRRVISAKWHGIRGAFAGFEPTLVAEFGQDDVERLLCDARVVRNRAKLEAIIDNAQAVLELDAEHHGFARYLQSHGGFEQTVADLKRQFRFIGDSGAYHFLYVVDEPVPTCQEWFAAPARKLRRRRVTATPRRAPRPTA
jgi:Methyladenine glycosylase